MITNYESQYGEIKRMREIRDEIGLKIMNMTWEEQKTFFQEGVKQWNAECEQKGDENDN